MAEEEGANASSVNVEEIDPLEVLLEIEAVLQDRVRRIRSKIFSDVQVDEPTKVEGMIGERPVVSAAAAAAAGYALGFVVRRFIPIPFLGRKK